MHVFPRLLVTGLLLVGFTAGCSTPGIRARQHAADFRQLPAADQKLVLHGRVRPGLSQAGVYIAWGAPDQKTSECAFKDKMGRETWIYRQRVTFSEAMNSYDHFGPSHGYGDLPPERWLRPGYGIGGIGNEGLLQYQPNVRSLDTLRIAVFDTGKVDRYKTPGGKWVHPAQDVPAKAKPTTAPANHAPSHASATVRSKPPAAHANRSPDFRRPGHSPHRANQLSKTKVKVTGKGRSHEHARKAIRSSGKNKSGHSLQSSGKSLENHQRTTRGHAEKHAHGEPSRTGPGPAPVR